MGNTTAKDKKSLLTETVAWRHTVTGWVTARLDPNNINNNNTKRGTDLNNVLQCHDDAGFLHERSIRQLRGAMIHDA